MEEVLLLILRNKLILYKKLCFLKIQSSNITYFKSYTRFVETYQFCKRINYLGLIFIFHNIKNCSKENVSKIKKKTVQ